MQDWTVVLTGWNHHTLLLVPTLCMFLSESHWWAMLSQCSVSPLDLNLSYDAWSWMWREHECSFPVRCQGLLLSRCLIKWNSPTTLPNMKTKIEHVQQFSWVCFCLVLNRLPCSFIWHNRANCWWGFMRHWTTNEVMQQHLLSPIKCEYVRQKRGSNWHF